MKFYQCEKKNKMYVKFEEPKVHHAKKSRRFIKKKEKYSSSTERCKCIEARKKFKECIKMTEIH